MRGSAVADEVRTECPGGQCCMTNSITKNRVGRFVNRCGPGDLDVRADQQGVDQAETCCVPKVSETALSRWLSGESIGSIHACRNGKEITHTLPFPRYSAPGGLRQVPGRAAESS